jgi:hypothetical protein
MCFGHSRCRRRHYERLAGESTAASDPGELVIRAARADDIDRVLDLLTHYDQPRTVFEPWYGHDPAYRPELSWLAETNGRPVAHLRIYPRQLRPGGGSTMRVAGIGTSSRPRRLDPQR